jgi:hypothetical protein
MYTDRNEWDPWLATEPEADYTLESKSGYVGSKYTWNGKKIKTGAMVVDSVVFGKYIASFITFGDDPEPSLVEWNLEKTGTGTLIKWSFTAEGAWPVERLMLNLMKGGMAKSFTDGLDNYGKYLAANPPVLSSLGEIEYGTVGPMVAMVKGATARMDELATLMGELYGNIWAVIQEQGLEVVGPPFTHYLSFDHETGVSEILAGIPVSGKAKEAGEVMVKKYKEIDVIQAVHTGPYYDLPVSYQKLMDYIAENQIETKWESIDIYINDPMSQPDITRLKTLIAFPLK